MRETSLRAALLVLRELLQQLSNSSIVFAVAIIAPWLDLEMIKDRAIAALFGLLGIGIFLHCSSLFIRKEK